MPTPRDAIRLGSDRLYSETNFYPPLEIDHYSPPRTSAARDRMASPQLPQGPRTAAPLHGPYVSAHTRIGPEPSYNLAVPPPSLQDLPEHVDGDILSVEKNLLRMLNLFHTVHGGQKPPFAIEPGRSTSQFRLHCGNPQLQFTTVDGIPARYGRFKYGSTQLVVVQVQQPFDWQNDVPYFVTPADKSGDIVKWHVWTRQMKTMTPNYQMLSTTSASGLQHARGLRTSPVPTKMEEGEIATEKSTSTQSAPAHKGGFAQVQAINRVLLKRAVADKQLMSRPAPPRASPLTYAHAQRDAAAAALSSPLSADTSRYNESTRATTADVSNTATTVPSSLHKRKRSSQSPVLSDEAKVNRRVKHEPNEDNSTSLVPGPQTNNDDQIPYSSVEDGLPPTASVASRPAPVASPLVLFLNRNCDVVRERPFRLCDSVRKLFAQAQAAGTILKDSMILRVLVGGNVACSVCRDDEEDYEDMYKMIVKTKASDLTVTDDE